MESFFRLRSWCLDLLFPKACVGCGREGAFLCGRCREGTLFSAPSCLVCNLRNFTGILCGSCAERVHLRRFLAPFSYRNPLIRELIHTYKYEGVRELAGTLADEVQRFLTFYGIRIAPGALLVPIPLHRSRERERGFNQAALLAANLGARLGLRVLPVLERNRATEQQIDMDSYERRRQNVRHAFRAPDTAAIAGKPVVLIDDVATSGATLSEAAAVLREAGARTVWAIVIAKG